MLKDENTTNSLKEIESSFREATQQKIKGKALAGTFETFYWFMDKLKEYEIRRHDITSR
jgi:hypothetical protein